MVNDFFFDYYRFGKGDLRNKKSIMVDLDSLNVAVSENDSTLRYQVDPEFVYKYVEILEQSNSQLGIWWTALGVFIASLGVLFTIGAIVAGWFIYRQGKDFRKNQDEVLNEYNRRFEEVVYSYEQTMEPYIKRLKSDLDYIEVQKEKIETESNPKVETIMELNLKIKDLQNEVQSLSQRGNRLKGQPGIGQPGIGQPGISQSGTGQPGKS
ncbi:MAG: hypothetical protein WD426_00065 [Anditalea sp.]